MKLHSACEYTPAKRDEMTFGYLSTDLPTGLVPDVTGSACFYSQEFIAKKMTELDNIFVGMRRSTIDKTEMVRQLILYSAIIKIGTDDKLRIAVYQRAAGAEAKLKGGYSFGFGGHVETQDLRLHAIETEDSDFTPIPGSISSYISTLASGYREIEEEVQVKIGELITRPMPDEMIGQKVMDHFSFTEVKVVVSDATFEELKDSAVFHCDKFLITVDENNPTVGCLVHKGNITMQEIYKGIFIDEPTVTDKTILPLPPTAVGFISDIKREQPGWIGNTHLGVVGLVVVPEDAEFSVTEDKYTTIGWLTRDEILAVKDKLEPWSLILTDHLDEIEEFARDKQ